MKARELLTVHDLIVTNYTITQIAPGKYVHKFTPATTPTVYEFEANSTPLVVDGERYNIGYTTDPQGRNIVDVSALSKTSDVNPMLSFMSAQHLADTTASQQKQKNDLRVTHTATDGYYWGKKYAWRRYGTVIPKNAFYNYLEEIGHPFVPCTTRDPERSFAVDQSIAYKDDGLLEAVRKLVASAKKEGKAYFKSPLYSKKFSIVGVNAITDKK